MQDASRLHCSITCCCWWRFVRLMHSSEHYGGAIPEGMVRFAGTIYNAGKRTNSTWSAWWLYQCT